MLLALQPHFYCLSCITTTILKNGLKNEIWSKTAPLVNQ